MLLCIFRRKFSDRNYSIESPLALLSTWTEFASGPLAALVLELGLEKFPGHFVYATSDPDGFTHSNFSSDFVFTSQGKKEQSVTSLWRNFWSKYMVTAQKRRGCHCSGVLISLIIVTDIKVPSLESSSGLFWWHLIRIRKCSD